MKFTPSKNKKHVEFVGCENSEKTLRNNVLASK
jgi:hypothetical protein